MFKEIALDKIKPNPLNPRRRGFDGPTFDELVASIRAVGVLEPVLVRPKGKSFELVAGERRYRASCAIAGENGGLKKNTIPAMVRELDDEQAFDCMMIENLQREDLSEREEAEGFKAYLEHRGAEAIDDLAQRTGIQAGYIRRRVAVLELSEKALKAWDQGKLKYAHLEVLIRVQDKSRRSDLLDKALNWDWTAKQLRKEIEGESPRLKNAFFELDECQACFHNTEKQKQLFALEDVDSAVCLKVSCFKQRQNNWLSANWKASELRRKYKTNGFRFYDRGNSTNAETWYGGEKPFPECRSCEKFISLIDLNGEPPYEGCGRACLDPKCKAALSRKQSTAKGKAETSRTSGLNDDEPGEDLGGTPPAAPEPRVEWHGEYFREKFYRLELPRRLRSLDPTSPQAIRLAIMALVRQTRFAISLEETFQKAVGMPRGRFMTGKAMIQALESDALKPAPLEALDIVRLAALLLHLVEQVVMCREFNASDRRAAADHLGIDLAKEWRIDEEYLGKKTKAEILEIGRTFKVFEQEAAKAYLYETLGKKRGKFETCKKNELVKLFLDSGANLDGVVPEEIILEKQVPSYPEDDEAFDDERTCRVCGCTDDDCTECVEATGEPCSWVEDDLCSRCAGAVTGHQPVQDEAA